MHDVSLKQDDWLAIVEKASSPGFNFVDCIDAGQRHVEAFSGGYQVVVTQQFGAVATGQTDLGFAARNTISYQPGFELIGAYGGLSDVAVVAIGFQVVAVPVKVFLQDEHCL